jgi:hypothetical protein
MDTDEDGKYMVSSYPSCKVFMLHISAYSCSFSVDACSMFGDLSSSVGAAASAMFPLISAFSGPLELAICEATGSEN